MKDRKNATTGDPLEKAFIKMARAAHARMKAWADEHGVYVRTGSRAIFRSGHWETVEPRLDYSSLSRDQYNHGIFEVLEIRDCVKAHLKAGILRDPEKKWEMPTSDDDVPGHWIHEMLRPVIEAVEVADGFDVSEETILESYRRYREGWAAKVADWIVVVPLVQFKSGTVSQLDLGCRLRLQPFDPDEKTEVSDRSRSVTTGRNWANSLVRHFV